MLGLTDLSASESKAMLAGVSRMKRRLETGNRAERRALLLEMVARIELQRDCVRIGLNATAMRTSLQISGHTDAPEQEIVWLDVPVQLRRRGAELKLVLAGEHAGAGTADPTLVTTVTLSHRWFEELRSGSTKSIADLARRHGIHQTDISRVLPLAFLAPDIVEAILDGRQPVELTAARLKRIRLPHAWAEQRQILGFTT
jgi:hypothetical protein